MSEAGTSTRLSGSSRYGAAARSPNRTTLSVPGSAALGTIAPGTPAARSRSASRWQARRSSETRSPGRSAVLRRLARSRSAAGRRGRAAAPRSGGGRARAARGCEARAAQELGPWPERVQAEVLRRRLLGHAMEAAGDAAGLGPQRPPPGGEPERDDRHANAVLRVEPAASIRSGSRTGSASSSRGVAPPSSGRGQSNQATTPAGRERVAQLADEARERAQPARLLALGLRPLARRDPALEAPQVDAEQRRRGRAAGPRRAATSQRASSLGVRASPTSSASPSAASAWLRRSSAIRSASRASLVDRRPRVEHRAVHEQRQVGVGRRPALQRRGAYRRREPRDLARRPPAGRAPRRRAGR